MRLNEESKEVITIPTSEYKRLLRENAELKADLKIVKVIWQNFMKSRGE